MEMIYLVGGYYGKNTISGKVLSFFIFLIVNFKCIYYYSFYSKIYLTFNKSRTEPVLIPDLNEIQSRLAYVSCERILETIKQSSYCEYIHPPTEKYGTVQFNLFDEINVILKYIFYTNILYFVIKL